MLLCFFLPLCEVCGYLTLDPRFAEFKANLEALPNIEDNRAGAEIIQHREGTAPKVAVVEKREIPTRLRSVFIDGTTIVFTEKRAGGPVKEFRAVFFHAHILFLELAIRHLQPGGEASNVPVIHHDMKGFATVRTFEAVNLAPHVIGRLVDNRIELPI